MSETPPTASSPPARLGAVALAISILGLAVAALPPFVLPPPEEPAVLRGEEPAPSASPSPSASPPSASPSPSATPGGLKGLLGRAKDKVLAKKEEHEARQAAEAEAKEAKAAARREHRAALDAHEARLVLFLQIGGGLGGLGILLALGAFVRREPPRVALVAAVLGVLAALWIYVLIATAVALLIVFVAGALKVVAG